MPAARAAQCLPSDAIRSAVSARRTPLAAAAAEADHPAAPAAPVEVAAEAGAGAGLSTRSTSACSAAARLSITVRATGFHSSSSAAAAADGAVDAAAEVLEPEPDEEAGPAVMVAAQDNHTVKHSARKGLQNSPRVTVPGSTNSGWVWS